MEIHSYDEREWLRKETVMKLDETLQWFKKAKYIKLTFRTWASRFLSAVYSTDREEFQDFLSRLSWFSKNWEGRLTIEDRRTAIEYLDKGLTRLKTDVAKKRDEIDNFLKGNGVVPLDDSGKEDSRDIDKMLSKTMGRLTLDNELKYWDKRFNVEEWIDDEGISVKDELYSRLLMNGAESVRLDNDTPGIQVVGKIPKEVFLENIKTDIDLNLYKSLVRSIIYIHDPNVKTLIFEEQGCSPCTHSGSVAGYLQLLA
jgi:hypothetical protein